MNHQPCYECELCDKVFPYMEKYAKCPLCEHQTSPTRMAPDEILTEAQVNALVLTWDGTEEPVRDSIHPQAVYEHRYGAFMRMGFDPESAMALAETRHDRYAVQKLIAQGCSLDTALQILI